MRGIATLFCLIYAVYSDAQQNILHRIIVLGNTNSGDTSFISVLRRDIPIDHKTTILFLGNYLQHGKDEHTLRSRIAWAKSTGAKTYFIPGFTEWAKGNKQGYAAIKLQQEVFNGIDDTAIRFSPGKGCPGIEKVKLDDDAVMLIMDSQWWLHEGVKPDIESGCRHRTKEELLTEIEDIPKDNYDKLILFVTFHPLLNTGIHSGSFGVKQHLFPLTDISSMRSFYLPLPGIGSLYPVLRNSIISKQDLIHSEYEQLAETGIGTLPGIRKAFEAHPNTIFISGQERNLQLLYDDSHYFINGGTAANATRVRQGGIATFAAQQNGFTVLELSDDKKLTVSFYTVNNAIASKLFTRQLVDYSRHQTPSGIKTKTKSIKPDSIRVSADKELANVSLLKRLLNGANYREEWKTEVKMKVFHPEQEKGGLRITGIGGGHESKSLQLKDSAGKEWILRSVKKNLDAIIPEGFQQTIASDFIHDMLSATNPYGALIVPSLQRPLGIVHASPELVFIPDNTMLGEFKPVFANRVALLEERKPAINKNKTYSSFNAINNMITDSDHFTDQQNYLKVRLIDFLIADYDRHHGQLSWGFKDTLNRKLYYPIPKDRDQAFYHNEGLIMKIARNGPYAFMVNFPGKIRNITNMGIIGRDVDRQFTNTLSREDWQNTLSEFKNKVSDSVIRHAVLQLPPEIYSMRGKEIIDKLITRRNNISSGGMSYYKFIARKVNVTGGNKDDLFTVSGEPGAVIVNVYKKYGSDTVLVYTRRFNPAETKEIRLFGFNGNDHFKIDGSVHSSIKLKIVGGSGNDTFDINGKVRNHLYDLSTEENYILNRRRTFKTFSPQSFVHEFRFRENVNNSLSFPLIRMGYNSEDGILAGVGLSYTTREFRKYPYGSKQTVSALFAPSEKAYELSYKAAFNHLYKRLDLVSYAALGNPALNNFFGFGNNTKLDPAKPVAYYRTRYDHSSLDLLVRRRFLNDSIMSIAIGPSVYYYWNTAERNSGKILEDPAASGLDPTTVYNSKLFGGGKIMLTIDNLNDELVPLRGVHSSTVFTVYKNINQYAQPLVSLSSDLQLYAELIRPARLMGILSIGGGHIFSKQYEFFQAMTLGGNNHLRGYRRNRFAGSSMAYASATMRIKLFSFNAYVLKSDLGLVGFSDIGRVWKQHELSRKWHSGYGGGIYLIPFNSLMLSAVAACSEEETLYNITLGTNLNLMFGGN